MKIGITGGIGSGKSFVVDAFEKLGAKVYRADSKAKELVYRPELKSKIISLFGDESFVNNQYNTKYISSIVFSDEEKLNALNAIIHPAVFKDLEQFCSQYPMNTIVYESALMIETGHTHLFDTVILVIAPLEIKIQRVIHRDKISRDEVLKRMSKQWTDERKLPFADKTIENIEKEDTIHQVQKLWDVLLSKR
jgi:dephospho-CoA kinase